MRQYSFIIYTIFALFFCFLFFLLYRTLRMMKRKNRIESFSFIKKEEKENCFRPILDYLDHFLESLVIFNHLAHYYERYIYEDSFFKKGMDFISLKIVGGFFFFLLSFLSHLFFLKTFTFEKGCISFLVGLLFIHFCLYLYNKRKTAIEFSSFLDAFFVIYNSMKMGKSVEESLQDSIKKSEGNIKKNLKKVLEDNKMGLSLADAFYHMYERTNIYFIKEVSVFMRLLNRNDINKLKVLDVLLERTLFEQKKREKLTSIRNWNFISAFFFALVPFWMFLFLMVESPSFLLLLQSKKMFFFLLAEIFFYFFYLIFLFKLVRGRSL